MSDKEKLRKALGEYLSVYEGDKEQARKILEERLGLNERDKRKTDHAMDPDDFDFDAEGEEWSKKIEAMTEEEAKRFAIETFGISEEQYDKDMAEMDGWLFDLLHPNSGKA